MPTVGEGVLRTHALGRLNRLKKLRTKRMKKTSAERVPMESQIGKVLEEAGIEYIKPATIIKRITAKAKPISAGVAGPDSSHHQLGVRRDKPELQIGQDDTNPKLSEEQARAMLKQALLATTSQMMSKSKKVMGPLGGKPVKPSKSTGVSLSSKMPKQQGASPPSVLPMAPMAPMQPFSS